MSTQLFTQELKAEAVRQVVEHGSTAADIAARRGASTHRLYEWVKAVTPDKPERQASELLEAKSEILRLQAQMRRLEEKRDSLKTRDLARADLFDYIEVFYNRIRRHNRLGGVSP